MSLTDGLRGAQLPGRDDASGSATLVKFHCEAVAKDGGAFGVGFNFLVLAADGRIELDYKRQVLESCKPTPTLVRRFARAT